MDYEKAYKDALERAKEWSEGKYGHSVDDTPKEIAEWLFPELRESEDKVKPNGGIVMEDFNEGNGFYKVNLAYLNKEQIEEIEELVKKWNPEFKMSEDEKIRKEVEKAAKDWYKENYEGENPQGKALMISAYIDGAIAWLEKQGDTNETINRDKFVQGVLRGAAINLITWIDYNAAEGNMCLSNMECEDIEDALVSGDWNKIYAYIKKKLEKQGERKSSWSEEDEKIMKQIDSLLYCQCTIHSSMYEKLHNWLKSLKPQPHWKPTEEQMSCFKQATDLFKMKVNDDVVLRNLNSLYNDLKKL